MARRNIVVILDSIRSRENVGSIFRTADGAGISEIVLTGITPQPPHPKISKTALGAENSVRWSYVRDAWRIVNKYKEEGYLVIALEKSHASKNIFNIELNNQNIVLVIGNEVSGVSSSMLKRSDLVVEIPMLGEKESLNVSVAFGIAVYTLTSR